MTRKPGRRRRPKISCKSGQRRNCAFVTGKHRHPQRAQKRRVPNVSANRRAEDARIQGELDTVRRSLMGGRPSAPISKLVGRLASCTRTSPCGSGACPRCAPAALVEAKRAIAGIPAVAVKRGLTPVMITVALPSLCVPVGGMASFHLQNAVRRLKSVLSKGDLQWCVGALDFSVDEHEGGAYPTHWSAHLHAFGAVSDPVATSAALRRAVPRSDAVARPVMLKRWDGAKKAVHYAFKTTFLRRIGCDDAARFNPTKATMRSSRVTKQARLRAAEHHEILVLLDRVGPKARLFQYRCLVRGERVLVLDT